MNEWMHGWWWIVNEENLFMFFFFFFSFKGKKAPISPLPSPRRAAVGVSRRQVSPFGWERGRWRSCVRHCRQVILFNLPACLVNFLHSSRRQYIYIYILGGRPVGRTLHAGTGRDKITTKMKSAMDQSVHRNGCRYLAQNAKVTLRIRPTRIKAVKITLSLFWAFVVHVETWTSLLCDHR